MANILGKLLNFFSRKKDAVDVASPSLVTDISTSTNNNTVMIADRSQSNILISLDFNTRRDMDEFSQIDERLQAIVFWVSWITRKFWSYQAVVTSVLRTKAEQADLLKQGHTTTKNSPHLTGRAIDIRLKDLPDKERHVPILLDKINSKWLRSDGFRTAIAHGTGDNFHLHLQIQAQPKEA